MFTKRVFGSDFPFPPPFPPPPPPPTDGGSNRGGGGRSRLPTEPSLPCPACSIHCATPTHVAVAYSPSWLILTGTSSHPRSPSLTSATGGPKLPSPSPSAAFFLSITTSCHAKFLCGNAFLTASLAAHLPFSASARSPPHPNKRRRKENSPPRQKHHLPTQPNLLPLLPPLFRTQSIPPPQRILHLILCQNPAREPRNPPPRLEHFLDARDVADVCADREAVDGEGGFAYFSLHLCLDPGPWLGRGGLDGLWFGRGNGSRGFFPVVVVLLESWGRGGKERTSVCEE